MVNWKRIINVTLFLICGSSYTVINSVILKDDFPWKHSLRIKFQKPWFQLWTMMIAMTLFLIPRAFIHSDQPKTLWEQLGLIRQIGVPSLIQIIAIVSQNYGLVYMPPTVWQVFFGFQVLFATLFAVTVRKQQLFLVDWLGLFVSVAGMCFSGVAALLRGISSDSGQDISQIFFSFIVVIASHGIAAYQTIIEEKLLHDTQVGTVTLAAYEGVWGTFLCTFIFLPLINIDDPTWPVGLYEDTIETFSILGNSWRLVILMIVSMCLTALYQFFGIGITETSSAIHRNLYEILRPLFVWVFSLFTGFISGGKDTGEPLDKYTILEIGGFAIAVLGSMIYNRILRFPCFIYVEEEIEEARRLFLSKHAQTLPPPSPKVGVDSDILTASLIPPSSAEV